MLLLVMSPAAHAHESRPAYLEIEETAPAQFSVLWRTPVLAGKRLPLVLQMPGDVKNLREPVVQELADSLVERRWIDARPDGLAGRRIEIAGLQFTITDALVRFEMLDGRSWTVIARPSQPCVSRRSRCRAISCRASCSTSRAPPRVRAWRRPRACRG